MQNTGTGAYPLRVFISGSLLTDPFKFYLTSTKNVSTISYFSLPRNSAYAIGDIGFNNSNFTQSTGTGVSQRNDEIILDDGHGGVAAVGFADGHVSKMKSSQMGWDKKKGDPDALWDLE